MQLIDKILVRMKLLFPLCFNYDDYVSSMTIIKMTENWTHTYIKFIHFECTKTKLRATYEGRRLSSITIMN